MRFVYERALEHRELSAPNFLGLAAIDIDENRTADAVRLLKRLISVSNNMYNDMDSAAHLLEERHMPAEALEFLRRLADDSPWRSDYKVRLANAMLAVNARDSSALDMLKLVVADPKAAYADRVLSARALKGQSLPTDVSEELKLLAGRDCPQAVAESKPFFVPARTSAAQCSSSAKLKEQLLGEALALAPSSPSIRMDFVWAAFAANFDSRALVAAEPYLRNSYYYAPPEYGNDMSGEDGESASGYESRTAAGMSLASMSPNDAVKLIRLSSNAYIRKREYSDAAQIITQAQQILRDANSRQVLSELLKHVNDEIDRVKENDDRSPAIHADLDQDHVVRGRLLAGMPTPPRPRQEDEQ